MAEKAHTPPWRVGHGPNGEVEIWGGMRMNASPILASMEHDDREANAAVIVRAVNSHEKLVAALQEAIDVFEGMNDDEVNLELLPRLREALNK